MNAITYRFHIHGLFQSRHSVSVSDLGQANSIHHQDLVTDMQSLCICD